MSLLSSQMLQEIRFIGGSSQVFHFEVFGENGEKLELTGSTIKWIIFPFGQPDMVLYTKTNVGINEIEVTGKNTFAVKFLDSDSEGLRGKFVHRPIIRDLLGNQYIPSEGYIIID